MLGIDYHAFTYFLKTRYPDLINPQNPKKNSAYSKNARNETEKRYRQALILCRQTSLTYKEIAERCDVSLEGLKTYVAKHHRDVMLSRRGIEVSKRAAKDLKVRKRGVGLTIDGYEKYRDAINACDSLEYIDLTVSEIAQNFDVPATGLLSQLRDHFPEISERRERIRKELGISDNRARGARQTTLDQYSEGIDLLKNTQMTIAEAAEASEVSTGGLRNHLLSYHKDVVAMRRERLDAPSVQISSAFRISDDDDRLSAMEKKYAPALEALNDEGSTVEGVAKSLGLVPESLRNYLKNYYPEVYKKFGRERNENGRSVLRSSAKKYEEAIEEYKNSDLSLKEIAEKRGLVYNSFTSFIRRNHPEIKR